MYTDILHIYIYMYIDRAHETKVVVRPQVLAYINTDFEIPYGKLYCATQVHRIVPCIV